MYNSTRGVIAGVVAELALVAHGIVSYLRARSASAKVDGGGSGSADRVRFRPQQGNAGENAPRQIEAIGLGSVNSYLVKAGDGFVLIDTGFSSSRAKLQRELDRAGCTPGKLKLILLTHGDHDHAGNAAHLREKYGAPIGLHGADLGMVERGDMAWNRKASPDRYSLSFKIVGRIVSFFVRSTRFDRFKPDLAIDEGFDLSEYGLDARVLHIPGHSKGSIGIMTANGDLFCGDLLYNVLRPGFPVSIDDLTDYEASIQKLTGLTTGMAYPGHGKPFRLDQFLTPETSC